MKLNFSIERKKLFRVSQVPERVKHIGNVGNNSILNEKCIVFIASFPHGIVTELIEVTITQRECVQDPSFHPLQP